jgi:hypothetical protein
MKQGKVRVGLDPKKNVKIVLKERRYVVFIESHQNGRGHLSLSLAVCQLSPEPDLNLSLTKTGRIFFQSCLDILWLDLYVEDCLPAEGGADDTRRQHREDSPQGGPYICIELRYMNYSEQHQLLHLTVCCWLQEYTPPGTNVVQAV